MVPNICMLQRPAFLLPFTCDRQPQQDFCYCILCVMDWSHCRSVVCTFRHIGRTGWNHALLPIHQLQPGFLRRNYRTPCLRHPRIRCHIMASDASCVSGDQLPIHPPDFVLQEGPSGIHSAHTRRWADLLSVSNHS